MEIFAPPEMQASSNDIDSSTSNTVSESISNEKLTSWGKKVSGIKKLRIGVKKVLTARESLEKLLLNSNCKLLTSLTEFQENKSFISSSYIQYPQGNIKESLINFIKRYPDMKKLINKIEIEVNNYKEDLISGF
jgi:hypothetical protein